MHIKLSYSLDAKIEHLILPILSTDQLEQTLQGIADQTGIAAKRLQSTYKAELGEVQVLYTAERSIYLLGLGKSPKFAEILKVFRSFSNKHKGKFDKVLGLSWEHCLDQSELPRWVEAAANGLILGTYQIGRFKSDNGAVHPLAEEEANLHVVVAEKAVKACEAAAIRGKRMAYTQMSIFDLVNAPSNKKLPTDLANWALESGKKFGYEVETFDQAKIKSTGLGALLAVNRGSEHPASFIIMEHKPKGPGEFKKVGLVGKGVTFDTGGLSIKPSINMHYMKSDMGGAAAVFGTLEMAAKINLPVHLIGIVPATENSVDAKAVKPSDVIDSYSGKTIEIIDTDAEGRLILADGLNYMVKHYEPEILIDLATLTGSAVRTFGYHAAALFSNNDELAERIHNTGNKNGEKSWRLPIWDIYKDDIKSDVADIRNYSGRPTAGAIAAAKFLQFFTEDHPKWAHLDIAGVAFGDSEFSMQRSATAFGIRLLIELMESYIQE
ncbi:MAG: leucyl aminopeptidase [Saprospiraceae bacterium]|nr:leucyl aminopeptidase [Saprospiraceae bacterium]